MHTTTPSHIAHDAARRAWSAAWSEAAETKRDEIEELYGVYLEAGKMLFGGAFHQLGDINHFRRFVFKYMQVGAR